MQITQAHIALERRAVSAYRAAHNAPSICIGTAVEWYLTRLPSHSDEWSDWIGTYGEAELIRQYGVDI